MIERDTDLRRLLGTTRRIAVVGLSPRPERPSHYVSVFMRERGYDIVPVNPACREVLDLPCHASLRDIDGAVDMVDVFRDADEVVPIVEDAIAIGARSIWFQLGVVNAEAIRLAEAAGLDVVVDRCLKIEHARLFGDAPRTAASTADAAAD